MQKYTISRTIQSFIHTFYQILITYWQITFVQITSKIRTNELHSSSSQKFEYDLPYNIIIFTHYNTYILQPCQLRIVTLRVRHQKCHSYGSKLWEFWVVNRRVVMAMCGRWQRHRRYTVIWNSLEYYPIIQKKRDAISHISQ